MPLEFDVFADERRAAEPLDEALRAWGRWMARDDTALGCPSTWRRRTHASQ